jgi:hypothetical protein
MNRAPQAAEAALDAAVVSLSEVRLVELLRSLIQEVWARNLGRYEPDEAGDTPMSLGIQCSQNLHQLAIRRVKGHELMEDDDLWVVDGLEVSDPRGVLTFDLPDIHMVTMKVPMADGRIPSWDTFADWAHESQVREDLAHENSTILGGYTTPPKDQLELDFMAKYRPGVVRNFMMLWSGDPVSVLTAGWLAVPTLGELPFAAHKQLWWDTDTDDGGRRELPDSAPQGPGFDEIPRPKPSLSLKPRPATKGQA